MDCLLSAERVRFFRRFEADVELPLRVDERALVADFSNNQTIRNDLSNLLPHISNARNGLFRHRCRFFQSLNTDGSPVEGPINSARGITGDRFSLTLIFTLSVEQERKDWDAIQKAFKRIVALDDQEELECELCMDRAGFKLECCGKGICDPCVASWDSSCFSGLPDIQNVDPRITTIYSRVRCTCPFCRQAMTCVNEEFELTDEMRAALIEELSKNEGMINEQARALELMIRTHEVSDPSSPRRDMGQTQFGEDEIAGWLAALDLKNHRLTIREFRWAIRAIKVSSTDSNAILNNLYNQFQTIFSTERASARAAYAQGVNGILQPGDLLIAEQLDRTYNAVTRIMLSECEGLIIRERAQINPVVPPAFPNLPLEPTRNNRRARGDQEDRPVTVECAIVGQKDNLSRVHFQRVQDPLRMRLQEILTLFIEDEDGGPDYRKFVKTMMGNVGFVISADTEINFEGASIDEFQAKLVTSYAPVLIDSCRMTRQSIRYARVDCRTILSNDSLLNPDDLEAAALELQNAANSDEFVEIVKKYLDPDWVSKLTGEGFYLEEDADIFSDVKMLYPFLSKGAEAKQYGLLTKTGLFDLVGGAAALDRAARNFDPVIVQSDAGPVSGHVVILDDHPPFSAELSEDFEEQAGSHGFQNLLTTESGLTLVYRLFYLGEQTPLTFNIATYNGMHQHRAAKQKAENDLVAALGWSPGLGRRTDIYLTEEVVGDLGFERVFGSSGNSQLTDAYLRRRGFVTGGDRFVKGSTALVVGSHVPSSLRDVLSRATSIVSNLEEVHWTTESKTIVNTVTVVGDGGRTVSQDLESSYIELQVASTGGFDSRTINKLLRRECRLNLNNSMPRDLDISKCRCIRVVGILPWMISINSKICYTDELSISNELLREACTSSKDGHDNENFLTFRSCLEAALDNESNSSAKNFESLQRVLDGQHSPDDKDIVATCWTNFEKGMPFQVTKDINCEKNYLVQVVAGDKGATFNDLKEDAGENDIASLVLSCEKDKLTEIFKAKVPDGAAGGNLFTPAYLNLKIKKVIEMFKWNGFQINKCLAIFKNQVLLNYVPPGIFADICKSEDTGTPIDQNKLLQSIVGVLEEGPKQWPVSLTTFQLFRSHVTKYNEQFGLGSIGRNRALNAYELCVVKSGIGFEAKYSGRDVNSAMIRNLNSFGREIGNQLNNITNPNLAPSSNGVGGGTANGSGISGAPRRRRDI